MRNSRFAHLVTVSNTLQAFRRFLVFGSDLLNFIRRQPSGSSLLTTRCSTFCDAIIPVILSRSKKEMIWIAAQFVVAFVQNVKTVWDWTLTKLPSKS